jgi:phosphoesterase RecJ-like protein
MGQKTEESLVEGDAAIRTDPDLQRQLDDVVECIRQNDRFLVASHEEPDGDAIGSTLALGALLEQIGKEVVRYNQDEVPYYCSFLYGSDEVYRTVADPAEFDVIFLLDCSEFSRLGERFPADEIDGEVVVVDHHRTYDSGGVDRALRDEKAAATGELIYRMIEPLGAELDLDLARPIYVALMTDTGSFQYSNTSRTTFRIAGELLDAGVDAWEMTMRVLESQPLRRVQLLGEVLDTLKLSSCGRLAFIRIDPELIEPEESAAELTDGFINYGRSIRGVEVSTQLRRQEEGRWKVSFRSKGRVDVSKLAEEFSGGGHRNAAGCVIEGEPDEICQQLESTLTDLLDD